MNKHYIIRSFGEATAIKDTNRYAIPMLYAFGWGHVRVTFQRHREVYSIDDAQAVCDWLNERETWPEFQSKEKQNALL